VLSSYRFRFLTYQDQNYVQPIAEVEHGDWILCQVTSQAYSDSQAIEISDESFQQGSLQRVSYVRPGKLFTAHSTLIRRRVGQLKSEVLKQIVEKIKKLIDVQ